MKEILQDPIFNGTIPDLEIAQMVLVVLLIVTNNLLVLTADIDAVAPNLSDSGTLAEMTCGVLGAACASLLWTIEAISVVRILKTTALFFKSCSFGFKVLPHSALDIG